MKNEYRLRLGCRHRKWVKGPSYSHFAEVYSVGGRASQLLTPMQNRYDVSH